jgi:hypothetical protein
LKFKIHFAAKMWLYLFKLIYIICSQ